MKVSPSAFFRVFVFFCIFFQTAYAQYNRVSPTRGNGIQFIPNLGQFVDMDKKARPDVLYVGNGGNAKVYLRNKGVSYVYVQPPAKVSDKAFQIDQPQQNPATAQEQTIKGVRVDMDFAGANENATVVREEETQSYFNYYFPQCSKGILNVKAYNKITYKEIYKNTDIVLYGAGSTPLSSRTGLKYDIIINPGGKAEDVKLNYSGVQHMQVQNGKLLIQTDLGELEEYIPQIYQDVEGKRIIVQGSYVLKNNQVSFDVAGYNKNLPLIIDPWITYYGGSGEEEAFGLCTDQNGNAIMTGETGSTDIPVTAGAFQMNNGGGGGTQDIFIAKFDSTGNLLWATYYGGSSPDMGRAITSDNSGNIVVTGYSNSTDFPVSASAFQPAFAGASDVVIVKLNPSGGQIWATYYGGFSYESGAGVGIDSGGNIVVGGSTRSDDFPVTAGAYQAIRASAGGLNDAFIVKFDPAGNLLWATYFGGNNNDMGYALAVDNVDNIVLGGSTSSTNFPLLSAYQSAYGGNGDAFAAKFNAGGGLLWSTYYGGSSPELPVGISGGIAVDASQNVIITGSTESTDFPISAGAFQSALNGPTDIYLVKFDASGNRLWSTYYGGSSDDEGYGIAVGPNDQIYLGADTYSSDIVLKSCSYQSAYGGNEDNLIAHFDPSGQLYCATYIGGPNAQNDEASGPCIAIYKGRAYFAGASNGNYPVTAGAYQTINAGGFNDAVLVSMCAYGCGVNNSGTVSITAAASTCTNVAQDFTSGYTAGACSGSALTYTWSFAGGTPSTSSLQNPTGITFAAAGTFAVKLIIDNGCNKDSLTQNIIVNSCAGVLTADGAAFKNVSCKGGNDGIAVATAVSGTANYTYSWSTTANSVTSSVNDTIKNLAAGIYTVTITDNTSATSSTTITITEPFSVVSVSTVTPTNSTCGNSNGTAVASASGGTGALTYSWSNTATGQTASNLSAAIYTVTVNDANGCTSMQTTTIGNTAGPTATTNVGTSILCNGGTGSVIATATGGTANYTYSWSTTASAITSSAINTLTSLISNIYSVTITDANGCTSSSSVNLADAPALTVPVITPTNTTCGNNNGIAVASSSGGTGALTYTWSSTASGQTANGLSAATIYTVTVNDVNACTQTNTVTLGNTAGVIASASIGSAILCNGGTGNVTATATGGTANYTYSWSTTALATTSAVNNTISSLTSTIYSVTITDANGCTSSSTINLTEPTAVTVPVITPVNASCGNSNGSAVASSSGGTGALTYTWSNTASGQTANGLSAPTMYTVTVKDANACTQTNSVVIGGSPAVSVAASVNSAILCNAGTGGITATATGGTANYTYSWSTTASATTSALSNTLSALSANTYSVTITDANNCTASSSVNLVDPPALVAPTFATTAATCGASDGQVIASASGGTGILTYTWSNSISGATDSGLAANTYTVTVKDHNGCSETASAIVNNIGGPTLTIGAVNSLLCNGNTNGSITVNVSAGTPNFTFAWSGGTSGVTNAAAVTENNLPGNTYTITVTDQNGCVAATQATVFEPTVLAPSATITNASCGTNNGSISVTTTGGTAGYQYNWSTSSTSAIINNLSAATYTVTVTDKNGCTISITPAVINLAQPVLSAGTIVNENCKGQSIGSATITITGGTGPFNFNWSSGSIGVTSATTVSISAQPAGTYTVNVSDANSCLVTTSVTITEPALFTSTASGAIGTCGLSNGSATANAVGGSSGYTYSWSNSVSSVTTSTSDQVANLSAGIYVVTITDSKGCTTTSAAIVGSSTGVDVVITSQQNVSCTGKSDGSATVAVTSGTPGYTYNWSSSQSTATISALAQGGYTVTVTDANSCTQTAVVVISEPYILTANVVKADASCGADNGFVNANGSGGTSPYNYTWSTTQTTQVISNLGAGTYSVTVSDVKGCTVTASATLTSSNAPIAAASTANPNIMEGNSTLLNGSGGTSWEWIPSTSLSCSNCLNPTASPQTTTTYTLIVTDNFGCEDSALVTINVKPACLGDNKDVFVANVFSPNGDNVNDVLNLEGNGLINIYWAIYDRWGNLVFETSDQSEGWDGTYHNQVVGPGTYVYYLKATCKKSNTEIQLKGNVSVLR